MSSFVKSPFFIVLIALLMGLSALGIDAVLPAFNEISKDYGLVGARANDIQLIVYVFMLGFASMQLAFGILSDIFGRKNMLVIGLVVYTIASISVIFINDFKYLLLARFFQGVGLSAPRVLVQAIVRDIVSGRQMSRIMSFATMIFLLVPILAPSIGQMMLQFGNWHHIFYLFFALGFILIVWVSVKLPETLPKSSREKPNFKNIIHAMSLSFMHRPTFIYMMMMGMMFAMMMTYIGQAEQIYGSVVYKLGDYFPIAFAVSALGMVVASFLNSRIVMKLGMTIIVKAALLIMFISDFTLLIFTFIYKGIPPLPVFMSLLILHLFCFSLSMPNLNTLVLEPYEKIAGTIAAVVGTIMTIVGVLIGLFISQQFTDNVYPLVIGWAAISFLMNVMNTYVNHIKKKNIQVIA